MLRRFYSCLLCLRPPAFRERFETEMLETFEDARGVLSPTRLLADAVLSLLRQRINPPD